MTGHLQLFIFRHWAECVSHAEGELFEVDCARITMSEMATRQTQSMGRVVQCRNGMRMRHIVCIELSF